MKHIAILFSTLMVQAIMEGRKTKTRRLNGLEVVNFNPDEFKPIGLKSLICRFWDGSKETDPNPLKVFYQFQNSYGTLIDVKCPYGYDGDVLWVREGFKIVAPNMIFYKADQSNSTLRGWKPSIHMPKAACRIFLKVKSVRVERLQDISEVDAIAEGAQHYIERNYPSLIIDNYPTAKEDFRKLWIDINGPESWEANPWVWVIEYEVLPGKPEGF